MKIRNFEEIEVWKESRKIVNVVYGLTNGPRFKIDFGLKDQMQRAAVSCMSNVAEGFESGTNKHFVQFLLYTRRSSAEVASLLYVASDRQYINEQQFQLAYEQAKLVGKLANGFISYLKNAKL